VTWALRFRFGEIMKITTVGQLKQFLANVSDDVRIIKQNNETGCIEDAFISDVVGDLGMCSFTARRGANTCRYILVV